MRWHGSRRSSAGPDVIGSGNLVQTLLRNDLVDRLNLWVFPVLLSSGKRLFAEGTAPTALRLVESEIFPNGAVHLTYERVGVRSRRNWPFLRGCGQAGGQVSQELANPLVGMTDASKAVRSK
jgi:RibD C-terminal domain